VYLWVTPSPFWERCTIAPLVWVRGLKTQQEHRVAAGSRFTVLTEVNLCCDHGVRGVMDGCKLLLMVTAFVFVFHLRFPFFVSLKV